ncbi:asparagine--tRNA ligase [Spiroplasma endosymbiont of Amphibalanus improvisus]|uniref:asparagine--tRNA ligase n=1 Tax=Spiroplasma endosymbiont of Amphibalanus improvisus TaxID=3066327 RepID=UPI00313C8734
MQLKDFFTKKMKDNEIVEFKSFIKLNRGNKKIVFLIVNDGSIFLDCQVVLKVEKIHNLDEVKNLKKNSVVKIIGKIKMTPEKPQPFEIEAETIEILKECLSDSPLQKKDQTMEFLRKNAHIRSETKIMNAIFRIRSASAFAIHKYFNENNYLYLNTPIITQNDAEGAGETFFVNTEDSKGNLTTDFFDSKATLTVSGQLHAEPFAQTLNKVYTFGPTFRAENSNTTKHMAEFWMVEPEISFFDIKDILIMSEEFLKYVINYLLKNNVFELEYLDNKNQGLLNKLKKIVSEKFKVITYKSALEELKNAHKKGANFEFSNFEFGIDLQSEHEKFLTEEIFKKPVFVIDFPKKIKSFYMKQNDDNQTVSAFDLLVPGIGELIGGSQREDDFDKIFNRCKELKISTKELEWYLNLRKNGYYMSSGFGLGFERLIMFVTNTNNIKDVIPYPRYSKNLQF